MTFLPINVGTNSPESSIGTFLADVVNPNHGNLAWPTANKAFFVPLRLPVAKTLTFLWWLNGVTTTNNADCGIFDTSGNLLVSTGTTARAGNASVIQRVAASYSFTAGLYYLALACENTTGTFARYAPANAGITRASGVLEATSCFPLANATFAQSSALYVPMVGATFA